MTGSNLVCNTCAIWIPDTGNAWFCEECGVPTCERCGKFDDVGKVFLCPECFSKPVSELND